MLAVRIILGTGLLALLAGCSEGRQVRAEAGKRPAVTPKTTSASQPAAAAPAEAPKSQAMAPQPAASGLPDPLRGKVKETMNSGGYTYVLLATAQGDVWAAARKFAVAVGDEVEVGSLMPMSNFHSATLDRTFPEIQFVASARLIGDATGTAPALPMDGSTMPAMPPGHPPIEGASPASESQSAMPPGHPPIGGGTAAPASGASTPEPGEIEALAGGLTVSDLFDRKADLQGKPVKFRGRVVKANSNILGKNWLHIQDGTGKPGSNDITVTSATGFAPPGSVVIIEGTLNLDRDFTAGYKYDVIVEDATVTVEPTKSGSDKTSD